jgi:hypothetical protein
VSVPVSAVMANGKTGTVFVIGSENKIEKREVALGLKDAAGHHHPVGHIRRRPPGRRQSRQAA